MVHTNLGGNSHGPMVLKVFQNFPPTLVLVHGWLFPEDFGDPRSSSRIFRNRDMLLLPKFGNFPCNPPGKSPPRLKMSNKSLQRSLRASAPVPHRKLPKESKRISKKLCESKTLFSDSQGLVLTLCGGVGREPPETFAETPSNVFSNRYSLNPLPGRGDDNTIQARRMAPPSSRVRLSLKFPPRGVSSKDLQAWCKPRCWQPRQCAMMTSSRDTQCSCLPEQGFTLRGRT